MAGPQRRLLPCGSIPEVQVDEKCRRTAIVQHEIRHQRVHHVRIDSELFHRRYSNYHYSDKKEDCVGFDTYV